MTSIIIDHRMPPQPGALTAAEAAAVGPAAVAAARRLVSAVVCVWENISVDALCPYSCKRFGVPSV
jgi:hypothetical protein